MWPGGADWLAAVCCCCIQATASERHANSWQESSGIPLAGEATLPPAATSSSCRLDSMVAPDAHVGPAAGHLGALLHCEVALVCGKVTPTTATHDVSAVQLH
ncbi:hypothetical protein HPB48_018330 [Haemaphysalis longicornis]|uniref:Secreted protein n=1 Tax=Haemaphysalis longicornis TaxID=44386 RepID=A0A9J6FCG7_HAELO|nr:hypothetical protein HPB48_018330 [Haemaphysalis longicornis]